MTAGWKAAQAAERRVERHMRMVLTARRQAKRYYDRHRRTLEAIERHRLAVQAYPDMRDEADAVLWGRLP